MSVAAAPQNKLSGWSGTLTGMIKDATGTAPPPTRTRPVIEIRDARPASVAAGGAGTPGTADDAGAIGSTSSTSNMSSSIGGGGAAASGSPMMGPPAVPAGPDAVLPDGSLRPLDMRGPAPSFSQMPVTSRTKVRRQGSGLERASSGAWAGFERGSSGARAGLGRGSGGVRAGLGRGLGGVQQGARAWFE